MASSTACAKKHAAQRSSAPPGAVSARPTKTRRRDARSGVCDLSDVESLDRKLDELLIHHNALRRGLGHAEIDRADVASVAARHRAENSAFADPVWERLDDDAPQRQAHPVRRCAGRDARCRSRHVSLRDVVEHGGGVRRRRAPAWRRRRPVIVLGITKAYTTRVGSGPFPTELTDAGRPARWASAATSSAPSPAGRGAAAGSTR